MKEELNVLALFDGLSAGQIALERCGIPYSNYYASEIDIPPMTVTNQRYPKTIQVGDVRNLTGKYFAHKHIRLVIGGSPCQNLSIAGKRKGMSTVEHIEVTTLDQYLRLKEEGFQFIGQSYLFWEFVRLVKEINPEYFMLENVKVTKKWKKIISEALGVEPILINSSLVSAQNRERYYWTNIPNITQPEDKNILLTDIIDGAIGAAKRGVKKRGETKYSYPLQLRKDGKSNCILTSVSNTNHYVDPAGAYKSLSANEAEVLQTIEKGYTNIQGITKQQRYKMIGNSWTVDVIVHIFKNMSLCGAD